MLTRRNFLKGLLSSVAAGALIKNGILQSEQVIAEPGPWTIDMGANTWRRPKPISSILGMPPLRGFWPMTTGAYVSNVHGASISMPLSAVANDPGAVPNVGDLVHFKLTRIEQPFLLGQVVRIDQVGNSCVISLRDPSMWGLN